MSQLKTSNTMNKTPLQYGLIGGISLVIFTLILYISGMETYTNWLLQILSFVIVIVFMIVGGLKVRSANGGFLSYKDSFVAVFTIAAVSLLILTTFNIVLYNFINPELAEIVKEMSIEKAIEMMEGFGLSESEIEKSLADMENMNDQFSIGGQIISYGKGLIFWLIASALFALIPKKSPAQV